MAETKIKISLRPEGPDWIWAHFIEKILDPLCKSDLIRSEPASTKHHASGISIFQHGRWQRYNMGRVSCLALAEFAQNLGLPMTVENGEAYYVMDEKEAMIEFMKYGSRNSIVK